ncbi:hypothetical protein O3M35_002819 [Rhynocoris fuscipes]|uniref:Tetratricopeptide repeat protein 27 n=1 Tax=Rhynocoris fuscipes TaxID=488301 RepID=A0AAW1CP85_9HEMI
MAVTAEQILNCEKLLLKGIDLDEVTNISPFLISLQKGDYNVLVESDLCKTIFCDYSCKLDSDNIIDKLCDCLNDYLSHNSDTIKELEILCLGIASLQGFVQSNWTGPSYAVLSQQGPCINPFLLNFISSDESSNDISECLKQELSVDGEDISASIIHPELLIFAKAFLRSSLPSLCSTDWWLMRAQYIHQQILDEHSPTLQGELIRLSQILHSPYILSDKQLETMLHLELARIYLHYGKVSISEQRIKYALTLLSMEVNLSGALGRRTQYQKRDIAQLTMNVKVSSEIAGDTVLPVSQFPKDILLNDDVRLPHIAFTNAEDGQFPDLSPLQQAAIISVFVQKKKSQAKDHLQNEELTPFLNCILAYPKVWSFQVAALLFRSRLECEHKRTVERALLQTQELIDLSSNSTSVPHRMQLFYCSYCPPSFIINSECASILVSMGCVQSALSLYLKLQMWDEVIDCYNYLKLRHMAAEVIRERMKKGETVKLWCYLGDATDDTVCYQKAWELSGERSAQAQRHWALYHFRRKQYQESIEHFKKSLSINSLQVALWFRLGYATLMTDQWAESAQAYRRYCSLEPESFEAWNNLAKAYIEQGQKHRAYSALQEAVKCNYDTWQVWDNLMAVSSDCGYFEEVIHCYHRILDLKDKHIDEQILTVLTTVIIKGVYDSHGKPASEHRKKALELFGRITAKVMGNPIIWKLYAELTSSIEEQTSITRSKTLQYYQKAYTAAMQDSSWFKEVKSIKQVIRICQCLGKAYLQAIKDCSSPKEAYHTLGSAKLSLQNIITKIDQHIVDFNKDHIDEKFLSELNLLKSLFDAVIEEHTKLKSATV